MHHDFSLLSVFSFLLLFALSTSSPINVKDELKLPIAKNDLRSVTQIVKSNPSLSRLSALLKETEVGFKLDRSRGVSFFMPNNAAIEEESFDQLSNYLTYEERLQIIQSHILPEVIKVEELPEGIHEFETLSPSTVLEVDVQRELVPNAPHEVTLRTVLSLKGVPGKVFLEGNKEESINGMMYVIPKLLIPAELEKRVQQAKKKLRTGETAQPVVGVNEPVFSVPDHIKKINEQHWAEKDVLTQQQEEAFVPVRETSFGYTFQNGVGVLPDRQGDGTTKKIEGLLVSAALQRSLRRPELIKTTT